MRMSCNGCRVLRKGCADDCILKPCLDWIKSPESQANATLFLAKFYGRAGLVNLINSAPAHLHPEIFKSLLYEACGRIINPVHGSVGLMCSGDWEKNQAAVDAVLQGGPLSGAVMPFQSSDIRHLSKDSFRRVRSRRASARAKSEINSLATELVCESEAKFTITGWEGGELKRAPSHDSVSGETVEQALVNKNEELRRVKPELELGEIGLELTLGMNMQRFFSSSVIEISDSDS